jgi:hypothetical protein
MGGRGVVGRKWYVAKGRQERVSGRKTGKGRQEEFKGKAGKVRRAGKVGRIYRSSGTTQQVACYRKSVTGFYIRLYNDSSFVRSLFSIVAHM